jgi:26S proteasome regulatory subunit T5
MSAEDLKGRTHLLDNEIRIMRSEVQRINHGVQTLKDRIKENTERIKVSFGTSIFLSWTASVVMSLYF